MNSSGMTVAEQRLLVRNRCAVNVRLRWDLRTAPVAGAAHAVYIRLRSEGVPGRKREAAVLRRLQAGRAGWRDGGRRLERGPGDPARRPARSDQRADRALRRLPTGPRVC